MGDMTSYGPFDVVGFLDRDSALSNLVRAYDDETGEPCVVEWFTRTFSSDPARLRAFDRAARYLVDEAPPGFLPVERFGVAAGHAHVVHPWLEAVTLRHLLQPGPEDPRPSYEVAGHLAARICEALAPLHAMGAAGPTAPCHGNVAAERVLVTLEGRVKLAGACTAQGLHDGERDPGIRLDLATRPPEVLAGGPPSPRGDVYQVGILLYELLTGRPAFHGGSELELGERIRAGEVLPPRAVSLAIPEELGACAARAMSVDPAARFRDAEELGGAVQKALRSHGLLAGRREVAGWAVKILGDEVEALSPPEPRRRVRPRAAIGTPPMPGPAPMGVPIGAELFEPRVVVESETAPRADQSVESLEIELEGNVERDDATIELTGGKVGRTDPATMDLTLEGVETLESMEVEVSDSMEVAADDPSLPRPGAPRQPPKAPPPRPQPPPETPLPAMGTKPLGFGVPVEAPPRVAPSEPQPPPRAAPSQPPPPPRAAPSQPPPPPPSALPRVDATPSSPDVTRRADPTPAALQRAAKLGARLNASSWGRRVVSTLDVRRGPAPQRILYGDSTEFPLGRDYLVIISSAVECLARAGAVETEVHGAWKTTEQAKEELRVVDAELEDLASSLSTTVGNAKCSSKKAGPFGDLADKVKASSLASVAEARREEKTRVDRTIADAEARIARATSDLNQAMGLFFSHDPIELLGVSVAIESTPDGTTATIRYSAQQGLSFAYVVDGSQTEGFRKPRRVSELAKGVELQVGLKKQFLRKGLVPETSRLDDLFIRRVEVDSDQVRLALASKHVDAPELFDIELWIDDESEEPVIRHRPQGEHGAPERVAANQTGETLGRLNELRAALIETAQEPILARARKLVGVEVEGTPAVEGDLMFELAHRIALELGPTVAEIAKRSPSSKELALKVEDTSGVRQERYLERDKLASAFQPLPDQWKQLLRVLHVV